MQPLFCFQLTVFMVVTNTWRKACFQVCVEGPGKLRLKTCSGLDHRPVLS